MADEQKKLIPINYTNREYETIRKDLMGIAQRFYPDTFQDFSEGSFGSLMLDAVSYVGDQLSFYLDYNVNESFLDTAFQFDNIVRHGKVLGYNYTGQPSLYGEVSLFVLIPASASGIGPDRNYAPVLKRGATFSGQNGSSYILLENIDFSNPQYDVVVARVNNATGAPTFYAIKATGKVVSGKYSTEIINIGPYERFKKVRLRNSNVSEILSVVDSEGNEYFEVQNLSQDIIFEEIANSNHRQDNVPSILKPKIVSRKFVFELTRTSAALQFGSGESNISNEGSNVTSVALNIFGKDYVVDSSFDPTKLSKNENFGIAPSNTKLSITYRANNSSTGNISAGAINRVNSSTMNFKNEQRLSVSKVSNVKKSLEVFNEKPITGAITTPDSSEIKRRIFDNFATQNRAVTQTDYEAFALRMPSKFGSIKRVSVQKDPNSMKRNLNMYVLSESPNGKLIKTNSTIKNNLKTWLNQYRMINDTIDILDPYILNLGLEFTIRTTRNSDKFNVLALATTKLRSKYFTPFYIGEPFIISDVYQTLKEVDGVLDVINVRVTNRKGSNYSGNEIIIDDNLSPEGNQLVCPKNAVFEIKYPAVDIIGKVR